MTTADQTNDHPAPSCIPASRRRRHFDPSAAPHDIFTKRGITREVRDARGYHLYPPGYQDGRAAILLHEPRYADGADNQHFLRWVTTAKTLFGESPGGYVMMRHSVNDRPAPLAQLRPHDAIRRAPKIDNHARAWHTMDGACWCGGDHEKAWQHRPLAGKTLANHEQGKQHRDPETGSIIIPLEGPHLHEPVAKYCLPPDGREAKRFDKNPLTDFSDHHDRVWFVIEGVPKTDAVTSCFHNGRREAAFGVPSVTTWYARPEDGSSSELELFARYLAPRAPVIIVPDGDWKKNPEVVLQALVCERHLKAQGVTCTVAAPPVLKGVDDHVGAGRRLDDLVLLDRRLPPAFSPAARFLEGRLNKAGTRGFQARATELDIALLRFLIMHSTQTGIAQRSSQTIAHALAAEGITRSPNTIRVASRRLETAGLLTIDRAAETRTHKIYDKKQKRKRDQAYELPAIIRLRSDLRAVQAAQTSVADWMRTIR